MLTIDKRAVISKKGKLGWTLGETVLFVDARMMLYIMYFPVYRTERDYNNFTSAHSWPVITLRVWRFLWINLKVFPEFVLSL